MFRYCFRRTASVADAEDLTSIVFLELWRCRNKVTLHVDGTLLPWLYGVATNLLRKGERTRRRHERALDTVRPVLAEDPIEDLTARVDAERRMAKVLAELATLPARDQEILSLCAWEGIDMRSAAQILGIPIGTAKSRLSRARARLNAASHRLIPNSVSEGVKP